MTGKGRDTHVLLALPQHWLSSPPHSTVQYKERSRRCLTVLLLPKTLLFMIQPAKRNISSPRTYNYKRYTDNTGYLLYSEYSVQENILVGHRPKLCGLSYRIYSPLCFPFYILNNRASSTQIFLPNVNTPVCTLPPNNFLTLERLIPKTTPWLQLPVKYSRSLRTLRGNHFKTPLGQPLVITSPCCGSLRAVLATRKAVDTTEPPHLDAQSVSTLIFLRSTAYHRGVLSCAIGGTSMKNC